MRNTLQEQYNLIKEGKGAKDVFTKHAKSLFPHLVPNHYGFDTAAQILTQRGIISENLWGIATGNNQQPDWFKLFNESLENENKADAKSPAKEVEEYEEKSYDNQYGAETGDDVIFDQYLNGIQIETCNPKNADKSVAELKKMVLKNLKKDKLYYTKNAAFGIEGIGYTDEAPGLGKTKEVKGKYASSGMEPVKLKESLDEIGMFHDPRTSASFKDDDDKWENGAFHVRFRMLKNKGIDDDKAKELAATYEDKSWEEVKKLLNLNEVNMNTQESKLRSAIRSLIKEELKLKEINQIDEEVSAGTDLELKKKAKELFSILKSNNLSPNYVSGDIKLNKVNDSTVAVIEDTNTGTGLIKIHIWAWAIRKNKVDINKLQSQIQQSLGNEFESKFGKTSFNNDIIYSILIKKKNMNEGDLIKEELNLKEIDQVGEDASKEAKIRKINEEINKRKKKLKALETLKELEEDSVNPKKIKELYSEIKKLEASKNKLEKKGKKKEALVDEIAVVDKTTTSDEMADIAKQEKTTPAAVKKAVDTAKSSGEPVTVA